MDCHLNFFSVVIYTQITDHGKSLVSELFSRLHWKLFITYMSLQLKELVFVDNAFEAILLITQKWTMPRSTVLFDPNQKQFDPARRVNFHSLDCVSLDN